MILPRRVILASAFAILVVLSGCQSAQPPTPSSEPTDEPTQSDVSDVDTSGVTGAPATEGLVDPCSLLTIEEIETATGVAVTEVVRGAVHDDGSQLCAYAMDAKGSTTAAMAGTPAVKPDELGSVVNALKNGNAVVGVLLSAQDPDTDFGDPGDDDGDDSGDPAPKVTPVALDLGKGGVVIPTPNGGAAFVANDANVLLTIMDLIAGPASADTLTSLVTSAYNRL